MKKRKRLDVPSQAMRGDTEAWEYAMDQALQEGDFDIMRQLFSFDLYFHKSKDEITRSRDLAKRFFALSKRFHPDRHTMDDQNCYKVAFQALNEAYAEVKE